MLALSQEPPATPIPECASGQGREPLRRTLEPPSYCEELPGAFRRIAVRQLCLLWHLYRENHITKRQLRIVLGAHEMAERRRYLKGSRAPRYGIPELAVLVGGRGEASAEAELRADLKALSRIGLLELLPDRIGFGTPSDLRLEGPGWREGFRAMMTRIPNPERSVPVPRRILKGLAAGFSRAVTAYVLATLIRALFWHRGQGGAGEGRYRVDGRTKGSWIAETFGISRRAVTDARAHLIEIGWLEPLETPQWALNRWGSHERINPDWSPRDREPARSPDPAQQKRAGEGLAPATGANDPGESASPEGGFSGESASPCTNRSLLSSRERLETRNPATAPDPAGFSDSGFEGNEAPDIEPPIPAKSGGGALPPPTLRDIRPEDLAETNRLLALYAQAVERGIACGSQAGELAFLAMAERARSRGRKPGALLYWLVSGKRSAFITQTDEDAAARRLREHRDGKRGRGPARALASPELTDEERFVEICLRVCKAHRISDPYLAAREAKGWTRTQWDDAKLRYEMRQLIGGQICCAR